MFLKEKRELMSCKAIENWRKCTSGEKELSRKKGTHFDLATKKKKS